MAALEPAPGRVSFRFGGGGPSCMFPRMPRFAFPLALILLGASVSPAHAAGRLVSGPMLGYQTHREVAVWLETEGAGEVSLTYVRVDDPAGDASRPVTITHPAPAPTPAGGQPIKFVLGPLEMGARFTYTVAIDGEPVSLPYPLAFRTTAQHEWRGPAPDFTFLFGSCAYFNDPPYDRPGRPYGSGREDIWASMAASGADFMLWLGDTVYLREADWSSASGIWYRYRVDRATPALQPFLAAMPHYATWDDHEFGPNNANGDWPLSPVARAAFEAYWPNQTFGTPRDPRGVYHRFQWGDAVFFVLDNRTHRTDPSIPEEGYPKTQYGGEQLRWLRQQLASRNESGSRRHQKLTFIATGGQFLAERFYPGSEDHHRFQAERAEILDFIRANKIGGVVFLSGDVHYSEVLRRDGLLPYPLYEFTSSALTAGAHTRELPADPGRVLSVQRNNYSRISVSGPPDSRVLLYTVHDETGAELARHSVALAELAWPVEAP
jgi:Phosphodiesterase/alkaline phosphatase D